MNDYESTDPDETLPSRPLSDATPEQQGARNSGSGAAAPSTSPPTPPPGRSIAASNFEPGRWPRVRRLLSNRRRAWIVAAVLICSAAGLSVGFVTSSSATATPPTSTAGQSVPRSAAGGIGTGAGGSNARSGPASGGASGTVSNVSTSGFTLTTSAGQKVTIDEASSTAYQKGTTSTSSSAVTAGEPVLVLGTTDGTTITAAQVIVQPTVGSANSSSAVIPFQRGAPTTSKQVGQIPANWSQGSGTIVSGTAANEATEAALAAYPGGVVDRVVKLSDGEYNVHFIGVNWPHHVFVNQDFKVVGAE
jgi:hypothetical protein